MICPSCRSDNAASAKFCSQCGERLAIVCPACGTESAPTARFCSECGAPVSAPGPEVPMASAGPIVAPPGRAEPSPTASEAERKQATVLSCELRLSAPDPNDPEVEQRALGCFLEVARQQVGHYGGSVDQSLHGRLLAMFGVPVASEDHAWRAVLAAAGLLRELAARCNEDGVDVGVAVGIATGPVVVGGTGEAVAGPAITAATLLSGRAQPGEVLVSASTRAGAGDELGLEPVEAAGDDAPESAVFRLGPGGSAETDPSLLRRRVVPLVGRRSELDTLRDLARRAAEGRGQVVGVAGEAGAGKTRLLYELRRRLRGQPVLYWRGRCLSYTEGTPYFPLSDLVRRMANLSDEDSADDTLQKLRHRVLELGVDPEETLPYLAALVGIGNGVDDLAGLEAQVVQNRTFAALDRLVAAAARKSLLIVEIEDLHWVDATSERFLETLADHLPTLRVLVVASYRSGYRPGWIDRSYAQQLTLSRLTAGESRALVAEIVGERSLDAGLARSIVDRAEGNPFFLEELTRSALEGGTELGKEGEETVPGTVQGVLSARIDRLPEESKHLLRVASVLGEEFPLGLLAAVWDHPAEPLLADLQRAELLVPVPGDGAPRYAFRHSLGRDVAYLTLLDSRRRELHGAAGRALEALHEERGEEAYDRLAYHYARSGEPDKAVHHLLRFADRSARGYAHAEAAEALREALGHSRDLPEEERDRTTLETLLLLADSLLPLARLEETRETLDRHRDLPETVGDPVLTGQYHFWRAHTCSYLGERDAALDLAKRAIEAAREGGDETTEGKARYVLGREAFWAGRHAVGLEQSERAVVLLERSGEPWWEGQAHWVAGFHHFFLGRFEAAFEALGRARSIGEALDDYRLDPSWSLGYFHATTGAWERGIEECRRGLEAARDPLNTAAALGFLGYASLRGGDRSEALDCLTRSVDMLGEAGMPQLLGWFGAYLAEALLALDRPAEARRALEAALEASQGADFPFGVGLAERTAGRVAEQSGDPEEAEERLRAALEVFLDLGAPFEVAKAHLDLARILENQDQDRATEERDEAHRLLDDLGLEPDLFEAPGPGSVSATAS